MAAPSDTMRCRTKSTTGPPTTVEEEVVSWIALNEPLFDPRSIAHLVSLEWSLPDHLAPSVRFSACRPLAREARRII
ncbi:Hypothetical predicted protein [Pelobates cultripes]|uniref:Uncharacterized protein n=1 Tax=Pelobates cultripes TaxID=61616 RepID=A0AAD1W9G9_PELCU|nr:Hypothetical predicted protein [Pelobates cultripes]